MVNAHSGTPRRLPIAAPAAHCMHPARLIPGLAASESCFPQQDSDLITVAQRLHETVRKATRGSPMFALWMISSVASVSSIVDNVTWITGKGANWSVTQHSALYTPTAHHTTSAILSMPLMESPLET